MTNELTRLITGWKALGGKVIAIANIRNDDGAIGFDGRLLFNNDLPFFKQVTTGNTVLMGRKTAEGLSLPNRKLLVASRSGIYTAGGVATKPDLFIAGGEDIYEDTLHLCDWVYLTRTYGFEWLPADKWFPVQDLERQFNLTTGGEKIWSLSKSGRQYRFTHEYWVNKSIYTGGDNVT